MSFLRNLLLAGSIGLGSILSTMNIGCNKEHYPYPTNYIEPQSVSLEDKVNFEKQKKLNVLEYPLNILGGLLIRDFTHESSHAVTALAVGMEIDDYNFIRFNHGKYSEYQQCWVTVIDESWHNASDNERAAESISGPISDMALTEVINYNLRHGNISERYQPFWATTSLIYRWCSLFNAIKGLTKEQETLSDFNTFAENSGISEETSLGIVALHAILSAKRIKKEINVAVGRDSYPTNKSNKNVELFPIPDGLMARYVLNF